ncbi:class I SAM-dependent methyltransferase [Ruegeria sp. 2012CJ41-6]|uniref:Class I SAM-dependent methyltransferase n=1 Tax=Ruegeria spongiae TaxID=2942209 RepID=A0ABT0Q6Z6_9RHOB|nr:methyltransferase domain-containing protein [Ruegeria spongiae]MCL6285653.1 class I SAM-dependent methyltransferase [Ruegeria spongiae]
MTEATQPDIESSTETYAKRFAGPTGRWLLDRQTVILREFMTPFQGAQVLDVGGGHAQIAPPLAADGHDVTVLVSVASAGDRLRHRPEATPEIVVGDLTHPPVEDRAFNVVTAFRMMAHIADWQAFVGGLCRASSDAVIIDFPNPSGANGLGSLLFHAKKLIEKDTRRFRNISLAEVTETFEANGFRVDMHDGQFVLPMALHRALKKPGLSGLLEKPFAPLATRYGNPIILRARRIGTSAP